jgi:hypothetical protein
LEKFFVFFGLAAVCVLGFVFCLVVVFGCVWCGFCVVYNVVMRGLLVI